jgi:hypothetical protein
MTGANSCPAFVGKDEMKMELLLTSSDHLKRFFILNSEKKYN